MSKWKRGSARLAITVALAVAVIAVGGWAGQRYRGRAQEQELIAEALGLEPGMVVADVGAGSGEWAVDLARRVGDGGHVYATEVNARLLNDIRDAAEDEGLENVTVILGEVDDSGLPEACCDAMLLRHVYHHFAEPEAMAASLLRSLRPGGTIAVVEMPGRRRGESHSISDEDLIEGMTGAGFEVVREVEDWPGRDYCILFRRPESEP